MHELFEPDNDFIQRITSGDSHDGLSEMERVVRHCVLNHPANSTPKCNTRQIKQPVVVHQTRSAVA